MSSYRQPAAARPVRGAARDVRLRRRLARCGVMLFRRQILECRVHTGGGQRGCIVRTDAAMRLASVSQADGRKLEWIVDGHVTGRGTVGLVPLLFEVAATGGRWFTLVGRDPPGPTV